MILTFVSFLTLFQGQPPPGQDPQEQNRIEQLVRDLGAEDAATRGRAARELRDVGEPAIPHLQRAARSQDAERVMAARQILKDLTARQPGEKEGKSSEAGPHVVVVYDDWVKGIQFRRHPDGSVELTVPEKNEKTGKREFKTYRADSVDEFKREYPEVVRQYDIDPFLKVPRSTSEQLKALRELRERLGMKEAPGGRTPRDEPTEDDFETYEELMKWIEGQERRLQALMERWEDSQRRGGEDRPEAKRAALGVVVSPVGPALRAQLGLEESRGMVVHGVQKGSPAERAGLKEYDVLVKIDGRPIRDFESFRKDLDKALTTGAFALEVLRNAKPVQIKVMPSQESKEKDGKETEPKPKE